jgi:hypothetical protein
MHLTRKTYVKNWAHMKPKERNIVTIKGPAAKDIKAERISYIEEEIHTWRKANQIHGWFVNNVQDGNDDCKDYYVSTEHLQELLELIEQVLKSPTKAKDLLPVTAGFFFGGEEYGPDYFQDLTETKKSLTAILAEPQTSSYTYSSSW